MSHQAKKRFGQNFLVDEHIINSIINEIHPVHSDNMIEVGPGLGALTRPLLDRLALLHVVEIDRDIIARLKSSFPLHKLIIHEGDALKFDFGQLPKPLRIVGNLPYNISSPLLFHFASYAEHLVDMHFMLQDEVVERMVARPSTPQYGRLSVMLQYRFQLEKLFDVPPESFRPAPKVNSAIVRIIPRKPDEILVRNESLFAELVKQAFSQRRKTLRNTLGSLIPDEGFAQLGIDNRLRAENLDYSDYAKLCDWISTQKR